MSLYSNHFFPWLIDKIMAREVMTEQRRQVLAQAQGSVLEIGFGTGLNLPYYPASVERLTVVDPNAGMHRRAADRIATSPIEIEAIELGADERLPVDDDRFDTVVSTWTMCSIPNLAAALAEVSRILKPGGRLLFVEHGLASEPRIVRWQNRLNPLSKWLGDGCHLNRDIAGYVAGSPLRLEQCEQFYLPDTPKVGAWTYRGAAIKPV